MKSLLTVFDSVTVYNREDEEHFRTGCPMKIFGRYVFFGAYSVSLQATSLFQQTLAIFGLFFLTVPKKIKFIHIQYTPCIQYERILISYFSVRVCVIVVIHY